MANCETAMHSNLAGRDPGASAYFYVQFVAGALEIRGRLEAKLGHQLPSIAHARPDGVFAHWHWDGARLAIHNDRYGLFPVFW